MIQLFLNIFEQIKMKFVPPEIVDEEIPRPNSHTGLTCLSIVAYYHGLELTESALAHKYALDEREPMLKHIANMASTHSMRSQVVRITWNKALALRDVYPVLCRKQDGRYFLLAGILEEENSVRIAVIDPIPDPEDTSETKGIHRFWSKEYFTSIVAEEALLLKRVYARDDEKQPFSLRWFIPEFIKLKGLFAQIAFAMLIMTLLSLVMPFFFQIVIDKILPNNTFSTLNVFGIGITLAIIFNAVMEFLRNYFLLFATNKIDINIAMKTFAHLMHLPISFFEAVPSGLLIKHMQQTDRIRGFLSGNLFFTLLELSSLLVFIPILMLYSVSLTGIVLGFSLLMVLVIVALIKPFQRRLDILYHAEGKRQSRLVESLHGIHTVKSLALEPKEEAAWNNSSAFSIEAHFQVGKISLTANTVSQMLEMLMQVSVIWAGAHLVFDHVLSVGALIAFQMLSSRVSGPLVKVVGLIHEYQQIAISVKMLGSVMNTPQEHPGGGVTIPLRGNITFDHVNFRYRDNLPDVLHDVSFTIHAGECIGIVGRSGSGKSTLARLLQCMHRPQSGLIKIDGIDIRELDKAHLRKSVGIVLQENYFFQGSIRDNIRLTCPRAGMDDVIAAAQMAGAHEFISNLPRGYDTILEENAVNLSGSQKQRLALSRALLANPNILILDEATSALDPESEQIIKDHLTTIGRDRTLIIITHSLSMVRHADRIFVLNDASLVAQAPHDILVHREGLYRDFWRQQIGVV